MKVIIAGSREIRDYALVKHTITQSGFNITQVVCGMARGVDLLGRDYAIENNISVAEYPANWDLYGKRAGFLRNTDMGHYADALIAIWDGQSKGTYNMISIMKQLGKQVFIKNLSENSEQTNNVTIYTDGACSGNPGPGGTGIVMIYKNNIREFSDSYPDTTNNRMEIQAVLTGLQKLTRPCDVTIYSDSKYVVQSINEWLDKWVKNNWRNSSGEVKNKDLWEDIYKLIQTHKVKAIHVYGHKGDHYNEMANKLAQNAVRK
jgi:ribonuclease HI